MPLHNADHQLPILIDFDFNLEDPNIHTLFFKSTYDAWNEFEPGVDFIENVPRGNDTNLPNIENKEFHLLD
ncbi:hypothetical protein CR513_55259, partial [Mucuna pruriens]